MGKEKKLGLLKFETFLFADAVIGFMVMYYFKLIDKNFLAVTILTMCACIFSANASIQGIEGKQKIYKLNLFLTALFFIAGLVLAVVFWSNGTLSIF